MSDVAGPSGGDTYSPVGLVFVDPSTGAIYTVPPPDAPANAYVLGVRQNSHRAEWIGGFFGLAYDALAWPFSPGYLMSPGNAPGRYDARQGSAPGAPLRVLFPIPASDVGVYGGDGSQATGLMHAYDAGHAWGTVGVQSGVPKLKNAAIVTDLGNPPGSGGYLVERQVPANAADPGGYRPLMVLCAYPDTANPGGDLSIPSLGQIDFRRLSMSDAHAGGADVGRVAAVVPYSSGDTTHTSGEVGTTVGLPCKAVVRMNAAQSIPTGTTTILQWGAADLVTPPVGHLRSPLVGAAPYTSFTAPLGAGSYMLLGLVEFAAGAGGTVRRANVTVNGVDVGTDFSVISPTGAAFAGTRSPTVQVVCPLTVGAGMHDGNGAVQVTVFHDATAALNVQAVSRMAFYAL